jgi:autotransporter-associated beta strand protein
MNLSGGPAALKLSSLIVGRSLFASSETGTATGTLTLSASAANQLDISGPGSVVQIGVSSGNQTTGTMTIGNLGAVSAITSTDNGTAILVGHRTTATGDAVSGTLNLNGGTVTITTSGAAIAGGSQATSILNLAGGVTLQAGASSTNWIRDLDTAEIKTGGAVIDTQGYHLTIPQAFIGAGGLTKAGAGSLALSSAQGYTGPTLVAEGTLLLDAQSTASLGPLTVAGQACLGGVGATPATVTLQNGGKLLAEIADWTGAAGTGFTVLHVGALTLQDHWVAEVSSPNAYMNFSEEACSFPFLTTTGGIAGFAPEKVSVVVHGEFSGTGTWSVEQSGNALALAYAPAAPPMNDYARWDETYPDADLRDPSADHDGDGMSNFMEYAFGLDPTRVTPERPIRDLLVTESRGTFTYTRRAGSELAYTVWTSTDLLTWTGPVEATETTETLIDSVETVRVEIDEFPPSNTLFIRLRAE